MNYPLNKVLYFDVITSSPATGAASDADITPSFEVFEDVTDTDMGVGTTMTKRTGKTGNYRGTITLSAANGFEVGKCYSVIVSATVGGIAAKCLAKAFGIVPAETTLGMPKVDPFDPTVFGVSDAGTAQAATATTIQLRAAADFEANGGPVGQTVYIVSATTGSKQSRIINSYNNATDTATVDAWATNLTGTIVYIVFATPPGSVASPPAVTIGAGGITTSSFAAGAINAAAIAADAIGASELAADAVAEIAAAVRDINNALPAASSLGAAVNSAASAGDPWITVIPGAYGTGTAGNIVGNNVTAAGQRAAIGIASANVDTQLGAINTKTNFLPSFASGSAGGLPIVGSAMALTSGERDSTADALLDRANAIETGLTLRQALRLAAAVAAGKVSGAAGTSVVIRNAVADIKPRITATVDANGNRTAIVTDVT